MLKHLLKIAALGICVLLGPAAAQEVDLRVINGVLFGNSLVVLFEDGSLTAWSMPSGEKDAQLSQALGSRAFTKIASAGEALWGANGEAIFQWNSNDQQWVQLVPQSGDELEAIIATDEDLFQVYARTVVGTISGREHRVPELGGLLAIDYLRVLALYPQGETLWIGTGQGEWGGHLIALNTRTGEWSIYYDPVHYVTGITGSTNEAVFVSWSMSHFFASTLIRAHSSNAQAIQEFEELQNRYYQHISSSTPEGTLYGVEQNSLVEIDSGAPVELADLGQLGYGVEPNAIGVAPAIVALIPVDTGTVVILHERSLPILFRGDQLEKLVR